MDSTARQGTRVYPSLVRPVHVAGVERTVFGLVAVVALVLVFGFRLNWVTPAIAALVVLLGLPALRRATGRDDEVLAVFRGHVVRAGLYAGLPPHTHPHTHRPPTF